jgi:hypothetical protein
MRRPRLSWSSVMPAGRITGTQKDYEARRSEKNGQANPDSSLPRQSTGRRPRPDVVHSSLYLPDGGRTSSKVERWTPWGRGDTNEGGWRGVPLLRGGGEGGSTRGDDSVLAVLDRDRPGGKREHQSDASDLVVEPDQPPLDPLRRPSVQALVHTGTIRLDSASSNRNSPRFTATKHYQLV